MSFGRSAGLRPDLRFKSDEVSDLLRLLGRAPRGALRTRLLDLVVTRLSAVGKGSEPLDLDAVYPAEVALEEERWLALVEDAAAKKVALKMRYFTASRRAESWRHASVHRVVLGAHPHVIATCHRTSTLRRFRMAGISDARLDPSEPVRKVAPKALAAFEEESLGGFHEDGPVVPCAFFVRDDEAAWVARNLPEGRFTEEPQKGGVRFKVETTAVGVLARVVVGLAARPETPALAERVAAIARASLTNATTKSSSDKAGAPN